MAAKTVFISSTFKDLQIHRRAVWDALKHFDVVVRGMEDFGARATTPLETCLAEVEQSDVYVGIIAYRLGSIETNSRKPFTLLEYEKAVEQNKEILIYLADDNVGAFPRSSMDDDNEARSTLDAFRRTLRQLYTVNTFSSPADLAEKLSRDFRKRFIEHAQSPQGEVADEYADSMRIIEDFLLMPKRFNGNEVRLCVRFLKSFFPASRSLCEKFNLDYGSTVGARIEILKPGKATSHEFNEIFCTAARFEILRELSKEKEVELYAELLFTGEDVPQTRAQLFGFTGTPLFRHMADDEPYVYIPPEGRVILLFSKSVN
jgi:hypothetical protein